MAIVGNKSDNYENEEVEDNIGKRLARKQNAIFQKTSAKTNKGIDELFEKIGKQILNPDNSIICNLSKEEMKKHKEQILIEEIRQENRNKKKIKKGCC